MFVLVLFFMLAAVSCFGHVGQGAAVVAWGGSLVAPVGACPAPHSLRRPRDGSISCWGWRSTQTSHRDAGQP